MPTFDFRRRAATWKGLREFQGIILKIFEEFASAEAAQVEQVPMHIVSSDDGDLYSLQRTIGGAGALQSLSMRAEIPGKFNWPSIGMSTDVEVQVIDLVRDTQQLANAFGFADQLKLG